MTTNETIRHCYRTLAQDVSMIHNEMARHLLRCKIRDKTRMLIRMDRGQDDDGLKT